MSKQQLTIENLAPYLPYGLKIYNNTFGIMKMACWGNFSPIESGKQIHIQGVLSGSGKPLLRPLSDLTKEIEHNGEKFVPLYYNAFKHSYQHLIDFQNNFAHYKSVKYGILQRLFEWHFDVFSLIDKGLALNLNDLKDE